MEFDTDGRGVKDKRFVTIRSPAGDSVGNFVASIGGMKGFSPEGL
jgi:hypothetical protein